MVNISKIFASILILIMVISGASFLIVKPTRAQTSAPTPAVPLPTPSVPQFTVKFVGPPYIVNTTYSLDPNTGKIVANYGYSIEYGTLEIIIKNQPFTPVTIPGFSENLYYNVESKPHSSNDWTDWFHATDGYPTQNSSSGYTILSYGWDGSQIATNSRFVDIPSSSQVDFQVQAMNGYVTRVFVPLGSAPFVVFPWEFVGESSSWSNTRTITSGAVISYTPSPSTSQNPTASSTETGSQQGLNWAVIAVPILLGVIVVLLIIIIVLYREKIKVQSIQPAQ